MHPNETIDKLSHILNDQIENEDQTKKFTIDGENSLKLIHQGQKNAIFFN